MTKIKLTKKQRHQVKSRWYYIFWGAATVSVFAGKMYVGSGYRQMSRSFNRILDSVIIELVEDKKRYPKLEPVPDHWEEDGMWHPTDPPIRVW